MSDHLQMNGAPSDQSLRHRLERIGLTASVIYVLILVAGLLGAIEAGWITLRPISVNEVGDLLAGIFGPLAIFWLVLGFFQQGRELRNSVATLQMQARELALSVEQQRELVEVTRKALDHERQMIAMEIADRTAQQQARFVPKLGRIEWYGDNTAVYQLKVVNLGAAVRDVAIKSGGALGDHKAHFTYWDKGMEKNVFGLENRRPEEITGDVHLSFTYHTLNGSLCSDTFWLRPPDTASGENTFTVVGEDIPISRDANDSITDGS